jgi:hypothetical protein
MESSTLAAREGADGCPFAGDVKLNKAAITQESARRQFPGFMADEYTQRVIGAAWHTRLTAGSNNMSTVKNPEGKKRLSLARDRCNRYGANSKSSPKNIQRGKQRRHLDERRSVGDALGRLKGSLQ